MMEWILAAWFLAKWGLWLFSCIFLWPAYFCLWMEWPKWSAILTNLIWLFFMMAGPPHDFTRE
jgi:hypothetical protein